MPNQFLSPEGDIEEYFVDEYWLIDQYIGDQLWTWGGGGYGRLGNAQNTNTSTPVTTFAGGTNWKQISAGGSHTVAIKTDGTLWIWGRNVRGQLGNITTSDSSTPITTFAGGSNWKQVSSGVDHTAAIKTDGTLWTWGYGGSGRLGNGAIIGNISTPVTTFAGGTNWKQVACGGYNTAAIKTDGTLWTWGYGSGGSLGNNAITNRSTPVTTFAGGTNWRQVSNAKIRTRPAMAAIKIDGTLWTWGSGFYGRLGVGDNTARSTPVTTFAGGTNWKQVSINDYPIAAIKTDGTLWIWGRGPLGINDPSIATIRSTPVTTFAGGTNWKQVSCGGAHTAAIKTDGTLWTWGYGSFGRLGNGNLSQISTPVTTFAGGTNWKQVSAGGGQTAAVQSGISAEYPLS
jgi:alpha-tubulin suppressor-like RCC1 family protein